MNRLARYTPLTGVIFVALLAANMAIAPNNPSAKSSGAHVISWITAHRSAERAGAVIGTISIAFLVFFAGWLYNLVRQTDSRALGIVALVGASMVGVGLLTSASIVWALSDAPSHYSPSTAQALNALDYDFFLPMVGGLIVFGVSTGIAVLREGWLPAWLGWILIALAVIAPSPAFPVAMLGTAVWIAVAAVILVARAARPATAPAGLESASA
jgi:hypothetical protein